MFSSIPFATDSSQSASEESIPDLPTQSTAFTSLDVEISDEPSIDLLDLTNSDDIPTYRFTDIPTDQSTNIPTFRFSDMQIDQLEAEPSPTEQTSLDTKPGKTWKKTQGLNSRKSVRWSAVPVAPM